MNALNIKTLNDQVIDLAKKDFSPEKIASMLDLNVDDVRLIIGVGRDIVGHNNIEELLADYRPKALKVLFTIMNDTSEKSHVRVVAAKAIYQSGSDLSEGDAELLGRRLQEMRDKVSKVLDKTKVINITPVTTTASNGEMILKE